MNMKTHYLFSSNQGDVPVNKMMLARPFVARPLENHPFLTLEDFFEAVKHFIWQNEGQILSHLPRKIQGSPATPQSIETLVIRYEKYGTLYHVISVEAGTKETKSKFALSVAQFQGAKETLHREFRLLKQLNKKYHFPYIPQAYFKDIQELKKGSKTETFLMALYSWFEGYHEWHFEKDDHHPETAIIWDMDKGYQSVTKQEVGEILRQASKILTLYVDPETYQRIDPWHHGAGDFVVKREHRVVDVRLITVRGYEPIAAFPADHALSPVEAFLIFFLELTIKMRLDKSEGMGGPIWASSAVLPSIRDGFFEALRGKEGRGDILPVSVDQFIEYIGRLSAEDLYSKLKQLSHKFRHTDPVDYACIRQHLKKHCSDLYRTLKI
jgi:hypothetical protein